MHENKKSAELFFEMFGEQLNGSVSGALFYGFPMFEISFTVECEFRGEQWCGGAQRGTPNTEAARLLRDVMGAQARKGA